MLDKAPAPSTHIYMYSTSLCTRLSLSLTPSLYGMLARFLCRIWGNHGFTHEIEFQICTLPSPPPLSVPRQVTSLSFDTRLLKGNNFGYAYMVVYREHSNTICYTKSIRLFCFFLFANDCVFEYFFYNIVLYKCDFMLFFGAIRLDLRDLGS